MAKVTDPDILRQLNGGDSAPAAPAPQAAPTPAPAAASAPEPAPAPAPPNLSTWDKFRNFIKSPEYRAATHGFSNAVTFGGYDKYLSHDPLRESEKNAAPLSHAIGSGIGSAMMSIPVSAGIGAAIPALRGAGFLANVGNQALTSGAMSAGEDVVQGHAPDVGGAALSAVTGGALAGLGHGLGKMFSPTVRAADAGAGLSAADKAAMQEVMDLGARHGVPVSLPQAAEAAAPATSTGLEAAYHSAKQNGGGLEHNTFMNIQKAAAPGAIQAAENDVNATVAPLFDAAKNVSVPGLPTPSGKNPRVPGKARPETQAAIWSDALESVRSDPKLGTELGVKYDPTTGQPIPRSGYPASSTIVADTLRKRLSAKAEAIAAKGGDPLLAKNYRDTASTIQDALMSGNPRFEHAWNTNADLWDKVETLKTALKNGPGKVGDAGGAHGLMHMIIQHPFVAGGLLGAVGGGAHGAMSGGDAISEGAGAGMAGLALAGLAGKANSSVNKKVVKLLQDPDFLPKLGAMTDWLRRSNIAAQGFSGAMRNAGDPYAR